jgi:predicted outer membrane protein
MKTLTTLDKARRAGFVAALALPLLYAGCDRRSVEDDSKPTAAEPSQSAEAGTPPASPDREVNAPVATNTPEPADTSETGAAPAGSTSQADALAMLAALDEHEIAAAEQALSKKVTGKVLDFAQMMKTEHSKNLTDTTKLGAANSTAAAVTAMKEKGEADLRALDANSGAAYEKAYMDAMVKGHTDALAKFDDTLLPAATDENIKQHLTTTRATVARHLDKAKEIQATLK